ncbi:hypothetical protein QYF50_15405 [Paenibacillus vini]|uniref:hypothetical protein n=1 Tax=Paenibacillus vini TaxID=1476024 RepID=UPI0025B6DA88|nr:hypothetical protein [Paenibacillus vini]MDN4069238.1 hypothetical protein [Paenibacillus vini]MDN4069291.1 hypothetical protein [Paenibacillus vini]
MMNNKQIQERAKEIQNQTGGKIFCFPVHEDDPFSKFAVVIHVGEENYRIYPKPLPIEEAAAGIQVTLEAFKKEGWDADYDRNVRFISYQAQIDAPSVTMRKLKKENVSKPLLETGVDVMKKENDPEEYLFSGRGLLKWSYLEMVNEKNPNAVQFMDEYYKILAMRKYGKTAAAIKQEVRRMTKEQAIEWIEKTYRRFIKHGSEIMDIMNSLSKGGQH